MSDFLNYWDTRIDANERFFNNYPHIANFAFSECQALWDYMEEERNALLTRHNALREAAKGLRDALRIINSGDHEDKPHSVAGYTLNLWSRELAALAREE